jgi:hypothetical protein
MPVTAGKGDTVKDYAEVLRLRAEAAAVTEPKPLDHIGYQNHLNLRDYADRRLRHAVGLSPWPERRSWLDKLLRRN